MNFTSERAEPKRFTAKGAKMKNGFLLTLFAVFAVKKKEARPRVRTGERNVPGLTHLLLLY